MSGTESRPHRRLVTEPAGESDGAPRAVRPASRRAVRRDARLSVRMPAFRWPPALSAPVPVTGAARQLWLDPLAVTLALMALAIDGALAFVLWRQFELYPDLIALHFNAYGEVDLIGGKNEIFKLPIIGAVIWTANMVLALAAWRLDPVLARLLLGVTVLVQVIFAVAAWRILS